MLMVKFTGLILATLYIETMLQFKKSFGHFNVTWSKTYRSSWSINDQLKFIIQYRLLQRPPFLNINLSVIMTTFLKSAHSSLIYLSIKTIHLQWSEWACSDASDVNNGRKMYIFYGEKKRKKYWLKMRKKYEFLL